MAERLAMAAAPFWLVGMGALAGLLLLLIGWLIVLAISRPAARELLDVFSRCAVLPVLSLAGFLALMSLVSIALAPLEEEHLGLQLFDRREAALTSVLRILDVGDQELEFSIEGNAVEHLVPLPVPKGELMELRFLSDQDLRITLNHRESELSDGVGLIQLGGKDEARWKRSVDDASLLAGEVERFYVTNNSPEPATLSIVAKTEIIVPEARAIPIVAIGLVGYVLLFVLLRFGFRKTSAIAMASCKEAMSQPLFYLLLGIGSFLLLMLVYVPYFTFGEDIKQFKDSGLTMIIVLSVGFVFWTAGSSVAEEIEGRTALTVLSKPVGRAQFVIGKYLGIAATVAVIFILLGSLLLLFTSYKTMFDATDAGRRDLVTWQECYGQLAHLTPGLVLGFLEVSVLASITVALSTRLAMLPNLIICITIYVVGHLLPLLVQSTMGEFALVRFMGRLVATLLPVLEYFNYYAAITSETSMPWDLFGLTALYSLIYITIAMLLALVMFEDRDLA